MQGCIWTYSVLDTYRASFSHDLGVPSPAATGDDTSREAPTWSAKRPLDPERRPQQDHRPSGSSHRGLRRRTAHRLGSAQHICDDRISSLLLHVEHAQPIKTTTRTRPPRRW